MTSSRMAISLGLILAALPLGAVENVAPKTPIPIGTMSVLAFSPAGVFFVGDTRSGSLFAIDLGPRATVAEVKPVEMLDVETKIAAMIGARADDVVVHDLAVDPLSKDIYLAISRNRGKWRGAYDVPNDLGDATELLRIDQAGKISGVELAGRPFTSIALPKLLEPGKKHQFKEVDPRTESITDIAWDEDGVWVAGLSNQEFSSAIWRVPYPFPSSPAAVTTIENYHVAHQAWETFAPVRTLAPVTIDGKKHLIAAYLCTPLVLFPVDQLKDGAHVKGRTISELGSGNYPLDLVVAPAQAGPRLFLANSYLPLMVMKVAEIAAFKDTLTEPAGTYTAGFKGDYRSGSGAQQIDLMGNHLVLLLRRPNGSLELDSWQLAP